MRAWVTFCQLFLLAIIILTACNRTGEQNGRAGADTTIYVLNTQPSKDIEFFDSLSEKDVLDFLYFSVAPGKKTGNTTYIVDFQITRLPPEWEEAEDTALYVSVLLSKENVLYKEYVTEGIINILLLRKDGGGLVVAYDTTFIERREALTNRVMEEPGDYIREEFPVYYTSLKIPENANSQVSFYGKFSEKDILDFMYGKGPTEAASEGVSYITGYKILTEDLVSWTGESEPGITDSAIVMLMTYAPCEPDEYGCTHRYCDLVILRAVNDSLSVVARTGFGPYEEFRAEGGGGRQDGLELELYRIHPSASAVGLRYIYSEGTDLGSEGLEKIDLYIVGLSDKVVMPVLSLDMGRSSYEYTGGPEGGISSSSVISSEIGISGEMTNGFYRIIHTTIHREIANGEVTLEESSSAAYAWETSAYMPERERE